MLSTPSLLFLMLWLNVALAAPLPMDWVKKFTPGSSSQGGSISDAFNSYRPLLPSTHSRHDNTVRLGGTVPTVKFNDETESLPVTELDRLETFVDTSAEPFDGTQEQFALRTRAQVHAQRVMKELHQALSAAARLGYSKEGGFHHLEGEGEDHLKFQNAVQNLQALHPESVNLDRLQNRKHRLSEWTDPRRLPMPKKKSVQSLGGINLKEGVKKLSSSVQSLALLKVPFKPHSMSHQVENMKEIMSHGERCFNLSYRPAYRPPAYSSSESYL